MAAALEVKTADRDGATVMSLKGEAGVVSADVLERVLTKVGGEGPALTVLDLSGLTLVSSIGMGLLVSFQRGMERAGREVRVASVQPLILDAFRRAMLTHVFKIYDTVDAALAADRRA